MPLQALSPAIRPPRAGGLGAALETRGPTAWPQVPPLQVQALDPRGSDASPHSTGAFLHQTPRCKPWTR